jgi:predicted membrane protein
MDFEDSWHVPPVSTDQDSFQRGAALGDLNLRVRSQQFRGATVTAVMSAVTVDLREAALSREGATLSVQAALSGIRVLVPREWQVDCEVDVIWGGLDGERFPPPMNEEAPRLRLIGMVVAGELCVR